MSAIFIDEAGRRHVFPDGTTPQEADSLMSGRPPTQTAQARATSPQIYDPVNSPGSFPEGFQEDMSRRGLAALPAAGGFAGSLVGTIGGYPGRVAGAGIGGGIGEGAREILGGEPLSGANIAKRGAEQGAFEATGGALAKGVNWLARPIMKGAVRASDKILREFPDVYETIFSRGLPVTKGGVGTAKALRQKSSEDLMDLLHGSNRNFSASAVARPVDELLGNEAISNANRAQIQAQLDAFMQQYGRGIDPVLLKGIKQENQAAARSIYGAAADAGGQIAPSNQRRFAGAIASGAKGQLETIPGVGAQEANTQSLIGAQRALARAERRPPPAFEIVKPSSWPVVGHMVGNPAVGSQVALLLNSPRFQAILRQSPRLAAALLAQAQAAQP